MYSVLKVRNEVVPELMEDIFTTEKQYNLTLYHKGSYHIETSPLICNPNQWTGFCLVRTSLMKEFTSNLKSTSDELGLKTIICGARTISYLGPNR